MQNITDCRHVQQERHFERNLAKQQQTNTRQQAQVQNQNNTAPQANDRPRSPPRQQVPLAQFQFPNSSRRSQKKDVMALLSIEGWLSRRFLFTPSTEHQLHVHQRLLRWR